MLVAVVGCAHGELDTIYEAVTEFERVEKLRVALVLCCGDFQAVRNEDDLQCLACPPKYRSMNTYYRYYNGEKEAPVPTIFVGGNHEASNHLQELPLGGLVAPNIYYLGSAGVVWFQGLRIGGISGIYVTHDYDKLRNEYPPYPGSQLRSVYHIRRDDVEDLKQIERPLDIFIGHDWPQNITQYGDLEQLLKVKPFLKGDIQSGRLGNIPAMELLKQLKPRYHFAAHMHVKFSALVPHDDATPATRFLALDKALPRRDFMQILDVPVTMRDKEYVNASEAIFEMDCEWLSILRRKAQKAERGGISDEEMSSMEQLFAAADLPMTLRGKSDFRMTVEPYRGGNLRAGEIPCQLNTDLRNLRIMELLESSRCLNSQLVKPSLGNSASSRALNEGGPKRSVALKPLEESEVETHFVGSGLSDHRSGFKEVKRLRRETLPKD